MAPPRQDPIPGSYIRETVTSEGATRWNVRAYDARTRATVTLGTFGNLAEAKGAYWAHEKKASAEKPSSSPNPPRAKAAPEEATRAKKPTPRSKTARKREPVAPPPSAKRAPKKGAVNTPAKKRPAAKGEKRPRAAAGVSEPRAPKRRRSSATTTTTTATTTITPPPRTPRDSARMRNLAEAAALATTSANKKLPPKKRGLPSPTNPNLLDTSPSFPTASFGKNHGMKRQSPRLASPRSPRPRRRSKGGHVIWSPEVKPPLRANTAVRQALCDAAADVAHVIAAAAPPPATKDSSPMTTLGEIARRLSDGLLGLLSSQCGAGGSQRSSGTADAAVLVPVVGGPGWRWSGDADALALAPVANASIGNDWPLAPNDTGAVDVSVESFGRVMAAAGLSVQHRVKFSLAPSE